jgi:hypothetical protein
MRRRRRRRRGREEEIEKDKRRWEECVEAARKREGEKERATGEKAVIESSLVTVT